MAIGYDQIMVRLILCCMLLGAASCSKQSGDRMPNYMKNWDGKYPEVSYIDMPPVEKLSGLKAAAYSGSGPAALSVMLFYINDDDAGVMQCYWASIAAQNSSPTGAFNLGGCYDTESYLIYSQVRAKFWYQKSAALGHKMSPERLDSLAHIKLDQGSADLGSKPRFWNISKYENAAYSGSGAAAMLLAEYYPDSDKSCYWYAIAAENGLAQSWSNLSKCYADKSSWRYSPHRVNFWRAKESAAR